MPSRLKRLMEKELKEQFSGVETCFLVDFTGLSGRDAAEVRAALRRECGADAALTVVKTSMARRSFAELEPLRPLTEAADGGPLDGPTAIAHGADDPVALARALAEWGKKHKLLSFKGGVLAGHPLPAERVAALAEIPPKPVLMGQVVGVIAAPMTSLLGVCQGLLRQIVGLADALREARQTEEPSEQDA
jgi:large subunit ribosomal protein L10